MLVSAGFTVGRAFSAFMSVPDDKNEEDNSGTEHSEQTCEYASVPYPMFICPFRSHR